MANALVEFNLETATRNFRDNPHGDNWRDCVKAMIVYQQWRKCSPESRKKAITAVVSISIGLWPETIVKAITDRGIEALLETA